MKIIRAPRQGNFTIIPNETLRDRNLTYRALGLLAELLSHDDGWETNAERLAARAKEGRDSIRTALNELREHRYMVTRKSRTALGTWEWSHFVYDSPQPVDNDPDASPISPVDNDRRTPAGEVINSPTAAFAQVSATTSFPSMENPVTAIPSAEEPTVDSHTEAGQPPVLRQRSLRRSKEGSPKKTDKNTPPPEPAPAVARPPHASPEPEVEEAMQQILRHLPGVLLPRSAGQMDALIEAVTPHVLAGWTAAQIVERAAYEPLPEQVHSPAGFLRQRLAPLSLKPPLTRTSFSWCGECEERTRMREDPETERPYRCPGCHPRRAEARQQDAG